MRKSVEGVQTALPNPTPGKLKLFTHKIKVPKVGSEPLVAPHPHEKLLNQACDSLVNMKVFSGV